MDQEQGPGRPARDSASSDFGTDLTLERWVSIQETAIALLLASEVGLALERSNATGELQRRIRELDRAKRQIGDYAQGLEENLETNRARAEQLDSALAQLEDLWSDR